MGNGSLKGNRFPGWSRRRAWEPEDGLSELLRVYPDTPCRLVDLDLSGDQSREERDPRVTALQGSAEYVTRAVLCSEDETLMLTMRSFIHYFGQANIVPFLKHLRSLLNPGEVMVHQTACYADAKDALFLDELIKGMGSDELAYRYHVTGDAIKALSKKLLTDFKNVPDAFRATRDGFTIRADYHIFISIAV